MASTGNQRAVAKPAKASISELESMVAESPSSDRACLKLAQILNVRRNEVALLRVDKGSLRFIYPPELRSAGVLPLSGSAVAARTASTRAPILSNSFMRVKHVSLFEAVKLGAEAEDRSLEQMPIQKIMSVPVAVLRWKRAGCGTGVAQRAGSRSRGFRFYQRRPEATGADGEILARMPFMKEGAEF